MESTNELILTKQRKQRAVSIAELYAVLEALLPFAKVEIECLADYVENFSDDPDHPTDAIRVQQGLAALAAR